VTATSTLTIDDLSASGAHRQGHFRLTSGLHSADYLQLALHLADTKRARHAGRVLADAIRDVMDPPEVVISPAIGGLIIGHETACALEVPFLFAERDGDGRMCLRRGFAVAPGQPVVVVEDVVTTGGSVLEVVSVIEAQGGEVVGLASMVNRSGRPNPFAPRPYTALVTADFPTFDPDDCPLCRQGVPITKPGSRPVT
jgi:orotate phosphoribosyltransferase